MRLHGAISLKAVIFKDVVIHSKPAIHFLIVVARTPEGRRPCVNIHSFFRSCWFSFQHTYPTDPWICDQNIYFSSPAITVGMRIAGQFWEKAVLVMTLQTEQFIGGYFETCVLLHWYLLWLVSSTCATIFNPNVNCAAAVLLPSRPILALWQVSSMSDVHHSYSLRVHLDQRLPKFCSLRPPPLKCFMNFTPPSTRIHSNKQI
jgi:hypothetical protein